MAIYREVLNKGKSNYDKLYYRFADTRFADPSGCVV
jgi:hypothetical protein